MGRRPRWHTRCTVATKPGCGRFHFHAIWWWEREVLYESLQGGLYVVPLSRVGELIKLDSDPFIVADLIGLG